MATDGRNQVETHREAKGRCALARGNVSFHKTKDALGLVWFGFMARCRLFNAKSFLNIYIKYMIFCR